MKCLTPEIYVVNEAMIMFMAMIMLPTGNGGLQRRSKCSRCDPSCPGQGIQPFFCDHLLQHRHPYHFLLFSSLISSSLSSLLRHYVNINVKISSCLLQNLCEGKRNCRISPTSGMFGVGLPETGSPFPFLFALGHCETENLKLKP